ncbi:MAG: hypothetical protein MZU84_04715 [Sphingobacterium sp.]|nr:hypothetical protein [Sphingobacterium sp.]
MLGVVGQLVRLRQPACRPASAGRVEDAVPGAGPGRIAPARGADSYLAHRVLRADCTPDGLLFGTWGQ